MKFLSTMNYNKKLDDVVKFLKKPTQKKLNNEFLADCHDKNDNYKKAVRARKCGTYLEMRIYNDDHAELHKSNFCKARLCPMCNWRLSLKRFAILSSVTELAKKDRYQMLFLTLTVRNVSAIDLKLEIANIFKAWSNLSDKNAIFKKSIHGWFRALEVTYNRDTDTYHPHLHVILAVKKTYWNKDYFITQEDWQNLWQKSLKIDYSPIIHIQKVYSKSTKKSSAEVEASKYSIKDSDYLIKNDLNLSSKIVDILDKSLKSVRLIAYGGILKNYFQDLEVDENDYEDEILSEDINYIIKKYFWNFGISRYREVKD